MKRNPSQLRAIAHLSGPMMVLAGPGSGKTSVIVERTAYMINEGKIPASSILVVTFSRAAATEMKERFLKFVGQDRSEVTFGTFHGIFYGILKAAYHLSAANILSEEEKYSILREMTEKYGQEMAQEGDFLEEIAKEISVVKGNCISPEHYYASCCSDEIFRDIFRGYKQTLKAKRKLDFDDMILCCYELFSQRPDILNAWRRKFVYILVDEFQDINSLQYKILQMLAAPANNLFIVGDDDQSIYHFRGARPEIMLNFPKDYPGAAQVVLDKNYRSTEFIVKRSQCLIHHNKKRYEKAISTDNEKGAPVVIRGYKNPREEMRAVAEELREAEKNGCPYEEMALLFRTNLGCRTAVEELMEAQIPFQMRDTLPDLYDHWIAKDLLTYLNLAMGSRKRGEFLKIANRPNRYLSRDAFEEATVSFDALLEYYEEKDWMCQRIRKLEQDITTLTHLSPFGAVNYIRYAIGYEQYVKEYAAYRHLKEDDLISVLDELQEAAKTQKSIEGWFAHIEEYQQKMKEKQKQRAESAEGVMVSTLHSVKGLEYDKVYLLDVNEGVMPYQKAVLAEAIEEERRMFYVGMTRARKELTLCYVEERFEKKVEPSRFLDEVIQ